MNKKDLNPLLRLGLVFLILANLSQFLLARVTHFSERVTDGTTGLLFGICFGCFLFGLRMKTRGAGAACRRSA